MPSEKKTTSQSPYSKIDKQYERKARITQIIPVLKKTGLALWSIIDIILVFGTLIFFVVYLANGAFSERDLLARFNQNQQSFRQASTGVEAQGLVTSNARVFAGAGGTYDVYAEVTNPNEQWLAEFEYYFQSSRGDTERRRGFALPRRTFYAVELSQGEGEGRPSTAQLVVENIEWQRIKGVPGGDIEDWIQVRETFGITGLSHGSAPQEGNQNITETNFTIQNQTAYSFWDVDLILLLRVGQTVVGVNKIRLPLIESNELTTQSVNWFANGSAGATPEVIPQLNIFDAEIYKDEEGRPTGEILERL